MKGEGLSVVLLFAYDFFFLCTWLYSSFNMCSTSLLLHTLSAFLELSDWSNLKESPATLLCFCLLSIFSYLCQEKTGETCQKKCCWSLTLELFEKNNKTIACLFGFGGCVNQNTLSVNCHCSKLYKMLLLTKIESFDGKKTTQKQYTYQMKQK